MADQAQNRFTNLITSISNRAQDVQDSVHVAARYAQNQQEKRAAQYIDGNMRNIISSANAVQHAANAFGASSFEVVEMRRFLQQLQLMSDFIAPAIQEAHTMPSRITNTMRSMQAVILQAKVALKQWAISAGRETPGVLSMSASQKATPQSNMRQIAQLLDTPIRDLHALLPDVYDLELMRHYQTLGHAIGELQFWRSRLNGGLPVTEHQLVSPVLGYLANQIQNVRPVAEGDGGKQLHIAAMLRRTKTRVAQIEDMMARMEQQGKAKSVGGAGQPSDGVMSATAKAFRKSAPAVKGEQGSANQVASLIDSALAAYRRAFAVLQANTTLGDLPRLAGVMNSMNARARALRTGDWHTLSNITLGNPARLVGETITQIEAAQSRGQMQSPRMQSRIVGGVLEPLRTIRVQFSKIDSMIQRLVSAHEF